MGTVTDGGYTISWAGTISGVLWGIAGLIVALDSAVWHGATAGLGTLAVGVAVAWTVVCGQRKCQKRIQVAMARQAEHTALVEQLTTTGPRKLV